MNGVLVPRRYQCSVLLGGPDLVIERAMSRKCYDVGAGQCANVRTEQFAEFVLKYM